MHNSIFGDGEELVYEGGLVDNLEGHSNIFWASVLVNPRNRAIATFVTCNLDQAIASKFPSTNG